MVAAAGAVEAAQGARRQTTQRSGLMSRHHRRLVLQRTSPSPLQSPVELQESSLQLALPHKQRVWMWFFFAMYIAEDDEPEEEFGGWLEDQDEGDLRATEQQYTEEVEGC